MCRYGVENVIDMDDEYVSALLGAPALPRCTICKMILGFIHNTLAKNQTKQTVTKWANSVSFLKCYFKGHSFVKTIKLLHSTKLDIFNWTFKSI